MRIGIDFDNTIICYDTAFNRAGIEKGMIPDDLPQGKGYVKDYLRQKAGKEEHWTWLQGYVYGTKLEDAGLYKGVKSFLKFCRQSNIECFIISHKTKYPYSGEQYDLHSAASGWIQKHNLDMDIFFEVTKEDKVKRINLLNCSYFIDDLPEFLALPGFNENIKKIIFDPINKYRASDFQYQYASSWDDITAIIRNG